MYHFWSIVHVGTADVIWEMVTPSFHTALWEIATICITVRIQCKYMYVSKNNIALFSVTQTHQHHYCSFNCALNFQYIINWNLYFLNINITLFFCSFSISTYFPSVILIEHNIKYRIYWKYSIVREEFKRVLWTLSYKFKGHQKGKASKTWCKRAWCMSQGGHHCLVKIFNIAMFCGKKNFIEAWISIR